MDTTTSIFITIVVVIVLGWFIGILLILKKESILKSSKIGLSFTPQRLQIIQIILFLGVIWFIMWSPVYDMVAWSKTLTQALREGFTNIILAVMLIYVLLFIQYQKRRITPVKFQLSKNEFKFIICPICRNKVNIEEKVCNVCGCLIRR